MVLETTKEDKLGKRVDREIKRRPKVVRKQTRRNGEVENSERDITRKEVLRVIKDSSNNKAEGMDDIPYELLKHLKPLALDMLVHIYQRCWRGEGIPRAWRWALIKPLLKEERAPK